MKKKILVTALIAVMSTSPVMADNDGASCGIGSSVMAGKSGHSAHTSATVIDMVVNSVVGGLVTFAMTTGTLGCDVTTTVQQMEQEKALFVAMNVNNLSRDMARGKGDYLQSVAQLMGVVDKEAFAHAAQIAFLQGVQEGQPLTSAQLLLQLDQAKAQIG